MTNIPPRWYCMTARGYAVVCDDEDDARKQVALNDALLPHNGPHTAVQLAPAVAPVARPLDEYHEDMGPVTWWRFPVEEGSWIGSPDDSDWPGYHTHFTPHPPMPANATGHDHE